MKNITITVSLLISFLAYSQNNKKIDSLGIKLDYLYSQVDELKEQINSEIKKNGYLIEVEKKYSFSKLLLKDKKYGKAIDTIKVGDSIKVLNKEIGVYKVVYNGKTGFVDVSDLKISESSILNNLEYNSYSSGSGSIRSSGSTYVKGHYRKTKSGKRVYVKGHRRKN
ncbi:hypothetical protein [Aquimarina atlantica]|nr:hypothetical protein [Aquimarina atlantica]